MVEGVPELEVLMTLCNWFTSSKCVFPYHHSSVSVFSGTMRKANDKTVVLAMLDNTGSKPISNGEV